MTTNTETTPADLLRELREILHGEIRDALINADSDLSHYVHRGYIEEEEATATYGKCRKAYEKTIPALLTRIDAELAAEAHEPCCQGCGADVDPDEQLCGKCEEEEPTPNVPDGGVECYHGYPDTDCKYCREELAEAMLSDAPSRRCYVLKRYIAALERRLGIDTVPPQRGAKGGSVA